jgi:hypothetical protein
VLQFYFLSIAANFLAGTVLAADSVVRRIPGFSAVAAPLSSRRGKLLVGLAALLVGVGTLFVPAASPLVIGDLFPSAVGMVMGIALLFEVFKQDALFPAERAEKAERAPVGYRTTLGLLGIAAAVLHFFLPERLIM